MATVSFTRGSGTLPSIIDGQFVVNTSTGKVYLDNNTSRIELAPSPVTSVNNKTGAVSLSYSDVGASKAIKSITRSGTTFTYTCLDGTTGTFTQQDNNTTYSAGTGISLSGTTFLNSGVRSIATGSSNGTISVNTNGTSTNVAVKGLDNSAFNAAYSKYCLHDLFAFCRMITPTFESTTNGSTWTAQTLNKKIFIQKEIGTGSKLFGNSTLAYRWTWSGNGFSYSGAKYLVLKSTYNNPGFDITIKVESQSASDSSWTILGTGTTSSLNSNNYVLQTSGVSGSISALRITITKVDSSNTTGSINLTSMQYLTDRPGDQGGDRAYELPFDWDENRTITCIKLYGAVWNDYAEYRSGEITEPGRVVHECPDGIMRMSTKRLESACEIISDTFGFAIGETDECKTPIAATGRVLAYVDSDRYDFNLGDAVCSGVNGTVSKMTREEIMMYPERIIGTVSEIPEYETWGTGNVKVNGRIWIRIR